MNTNPVVLKKISSIFELTEAVKDAFQLTDAELLSLLNIPQETIESITTAKHEALDMLVNLYVLRG